MKNTMMICLALFAAFGCTGQSKAGKDGLRIHAAVGQRQTVGYGSEGGRHQPES